MESIYVKLKDTSGTFFVASQGISINRNAVAKVEKDQFVSSALLGGAIVETTKTEFDAYDEKRQEELKVVADRQAKKKEIADIAAGIVAQPTAQNTAGPKLVEKTAEEKAKDLIQVGIDKKVIATDASKPTLTFDNVVYDDEAELIETLVNDAKVLDKLTNATA